MYTLLSEHILGHESFMFRVVGGMKYQFRMYLGTVLWHPIYDSGVLYVWSSMCVLYGLCGLSDTSKMSPTGRARERAP